MLEADIVNYMKKKVKFMGGECRKQHWEGRRDAPDWLILLHDRHGYLETKAPGKKPRPGQVRELERLAASGAVAGWADSFAAVDAFIDRMLREALV